MKLYNSLNEYIPDSRGSCAALGFFDGVHLGHRAVIGSCAKESGDTPCVVLTFRESPTKSLTGNSPGLLTDNTLKAELMAQAGADEVIFADFDSVRNLSPEAFVADILYNKLRARKVYCGFNYRFGCRGEGDTATLKELCAEKNIEVRVIEPVYSDSEQVSSSRIRALIASGEIEKANEALGYRFSISGDIGSGNHIGSAMGFPTVNIPVADGMAVPGYGVYASRIIIDGKAYTGATNIGVHPTVGENEKPLCETFILDYEGGDLYGKYAVCQLISFVRGERRFDSLEELKAQVRADCERIRNL